MTISALAEEVSVFTRALMASGVWPVTGWPSGRPTVPSGWSPPWACSGAGAVLVTLNTRFKGGEAAYILRVSGARTLLTVQGFLGVDYPGLLAGEDLGDLERVVVVRRDGPGPLGSPAPSAGRCGGAVVPPGTELETFLATAGAVTPRAAAARAWAASPGDVSDLLFTSGTTGRPKGAMATHAQSLRTFGTWASIVGLRQDDRYLVVNPFFHTFGYKAGLLASLMAGATVVPEPVFDVDAVLERIEAERSVSFPDPPPCTSRCCPIRTVPLMTCRRCGSG